MALAPTPRARLQATLAAVVSAVMCARWPNTATATLAVLLGAFAVCAWLAPPRYVPIQGALDRAARALAAAFTWIVLALVYFGLFTPLRLWRALRRQDPLQLRRPDRSAVSYLRPVMKPTGARRFERQF